MEACRLGTSLSAHTLAALWLFSLYFCASTRGFPLTPESYHLISYRNRMRCRPGTAVRCTTVNNPSSRCTRQKSRSGSGGRGNGGAYRLSASETRHSA